MNTSIEQLKVQAQGRGVRAAMFHDEAEREHMLRVMMGQNQDEVQGLYLANELELVDELNTLTEEAFNESDGIVHRTRCAGMCQKD